MTRIAAVGVLAILATRPQAAAPGDFGETAWGMSLAQVRKIHPSGTVGRTPLGLAVYRVSGRVEVACGQPSGQGGSLSIGGRTVEPANLYWDVPGTTIRLTREGRAGRRTDVTVSYVDPACTR